ncbi:Gti1/Pac2 family-domain-containing protein [Chytriomyces sp. MP71]|nr:Gti1/Pac2 family-domain-containing protein [Chytriomyces sp. MP71]
MPQSPHPLSSSPRYKPYSPLPARVELLPTSMDASRMLSSLPALQTQDQAASDPSFTETFQGFVQDELDCSLLVEACVAGKLRAVTSTALSMAGLVIQSGTVIVFTGNTNGNIVRWRDGRSWSPSKNRGPFLYYTEVDPPRTPAEAESGIPPRPLSKYTLSLTGSNGLKYRVIAYWLQEDMDNLQSMKRDSEFFRRPSEMPMFKTVIGMVRRTPLMDQLLRNAFDNRQSTNSGSPPTPPVEVVRSPMNQTNILPPLLLTSVKDACCRCPCGGIDAARMMRSLRQHPYWFDAPVHLAPLLQYHDLCSEI